MLVSPRCHWFLRIRSIGLDYNTCVYYVIWSSQPWKPSKLSEWATFYSYNSYMKSSLSNKRNYNLIQMFVRVIVIVIKYSPFTPNARYMQLNQILFQGSTSRRMSFWELVKLVGKLTLARIIRSPRLLGFLEFTMPRPG